MNKSFLLAFCVCPAVCFGQSDKAFVVTHDGDMTSAFRLDAISQITFDANSGDMTVQTADQTVVFTEAQQWSAVLSVAGETAIEQVVKECKDADITVYDITGKLLLQASTARDASASAIFEQLPKGVFIINNGKKTFKVTKQ